MCCFSRKPEKVSTTRIFARMDGRRQFLAYQMEFEAREDLAMILPLPVALPASEGAVEFIDLSGYPTLFDDLASAFPEPLPRDPGARTLGLQPKSLKVHKVGSFEASFVPHQQDFEHLDPRFSISTAIWRNIPTYSDYGFAVFRLRAADQKTHPMAFSFTTRCPALLFFPTIHVHDGEVHSEERFDHSLYWQDAEMSQARDSRNEAGFYVKWKHTEGIIQPNQKLFRRDLNGLRPNLDTWASQL